MKENGRKLMHNIKIYEKAYAKINMGLQVVSKREDGYHNLRSIMIPISLYDELIFNNSNEINIICDCKILEHNNIVYSTAQYIKNEYSVTQGAMISIKKNIPIGGGLAGGSSDAAATIRGLNILWDLQLTQHKMLEIAEKLGSDVPFCLLQKKALVEEKGNKITNLDISLDYVYILVIPPFSSLTKDLFHNFIILPEDNRFNELYDAIMQNNETKIHKSLFNDFEQRLALQFEKNGLSLIEIKETLIKYGCFASSITGSGSTIYGMAKTIEQAKKIIQKLKKEMPQCTFEIVEQVS